MAIVAAAFAFVGATLICGLSFVEHSRSLRPSILLNVYLFFTVLFDAVLSRTLLLVATSPAFNRLFTAAIGIKITVLILEAQGKQIWASPDDRNTSPEETCGPFSIAAFYWLNQLLLRGSRKILMMEDLYPLDRSLVAATRCQSPCERRVISGRRSKYHLLIEIVGALKLSFMAPILPRIAMVGFAFCQPLLINRVIRHLESPQNAVSKNKGYGLIGATAIAYLGVTVSKSIYGYLQQRFLTKQRRLLVSAIFQHTMELQSSSGRDTTLTLMSSDVERIMMGFHAVHNLWANLIQVAVSSWLLHRELGIVFLLPFGVVMLCFLASLGLGKFSGKRQKIWMEALQKRVGSTAHIISHMRALRMSGLTEQMSTLIRDLRNRELSVAAGFRLISVYSTIAAFGPQIIAPVLAFAATNRTLDTSKTFTSLSYLLLLTTPMAQLLQMIPMMMAGLACIGRVAEFLDSESRIEYRKLTMGIGRSLASTSQSLPRYPSQLDKSKGVEEMTTTFSDIEQPAILVRSGQFGWDEDKPTLIDINVSISRSQLTMVIGPIGSGKSTLCKALLGEVAFTRGDIILPQHQGHIGFCDQIPFLPNDTVRNIIIGFSEFDSKWYEEVVDVTALEGDFESWPDGDETMAGTKGATLSGGGGSAIGLPWPAHYTHEQGL